MPELNANSMSPVDPFLYKSVPKWHPRRIGFTIKSRLSERSALRKFERYNIPLLSNKTTTKLAVNWNAEDTAVTPSQLEVLFDGLCATEGIRAPVVEIGVYRGATSFVLAPRTSRTYFGVDPYIGWGGAEEDYQKMISKTENFSNFRHLKMTSGEAFRSGTIDTCSFVFIDAVHDYVNVSYDSTCWGSLLPEGGVLAFHDTDSRRFPGVQRAVAELLYASLPQFRLYAHVPGVVLLERIR